MLRPRLINALIGGSAGTGVMTLGMSYAAPMMMGMEMDMAGMLADGLGTGYGFGLALHVTLGVIIFPLIYVYVVYDRLRGPPIVRGLIWGTALWLAADLVVMPLLGAGFLMSNIGGWAAVLASLAAHMIYSGLLGAIAGGGADVAQD